MKIRLKYLTDGNYAPYLDIKALLKSKAYVTEGKPFPREGGGGAWIAYGLSIALGAGALITAGFLEELGSDIYRRLKEKIKEYVKKDPVFFIPEDFQKNEQRITIAFKLGEEGEGMYEKQNEFIEEAMDKLPEAMRRMGKFTGENLAQQLPEIWSVVVCKYSKKKNGWFIENIFTYNWE